MIHLDIKKLTRFDQPGHRIYSDRAKNTAGAGFEYVHVCVDDFSQAACVEVLVDERSETGAQFQIRAVLWLNGRGIIATRVMTDNQCPASS